MFKLEDIKHSDNPLLKTFVEDEGQTLLKNFLYQPTEHNQKRLDEAFKSHYLKVKMIAYFSKVLRFEAMNFDKNLRKHKERFVLTLDTSINDKENTIKKDTIADLSHKVDKLKSENLEELVEGKEIRDAIKKLTKRQQEALIYIYVADMQDTKIAEKLGVSQQSVSKTKRAALNKIRRELNIR